MTDTQWTVNSIKDSMRAAGSHWFDPDTMRFFKCKILPTVYQGPGGIFFVSSEQYQEEPRQYTVRQFFPGDPCKLDTVGDFNAMTQSAAIKLAATKAGLQEADVTKNPEPFRPISVLDQFAHDLQKHTNPSRGTETRTVDLAKKLISNAGYHHHYMELLCSDEAFCQQVSEDGEHPRVTACRARIEELARMVGAKAVLFSGDPRGCTVKLVFNDGFTNDFAREGYCVPTRLTDEE